VCYGPEKRQWPADTTHTSRDSTHGGAPVRGASGGLPRERSGSGTSGWRAEQALHDIDGGDLAAGVIS
jgi:hypothetical protein